MGGCHSERKCRQAFDDGCESSLGTLQCKIFGKAIENQQRFTRTCRRAPSSACAIEWFSSLRKPLSLSCISLYHLCVHFSAVASNRNFRHGLLFSLQGRIMLIQCVFIGLGHFLSFK